MGDVPVVRSSWSDNESVNSYSNKKAMMENVMENGKS